MANFRILAAFFNPIAFYPPTINALKILSQSGFNVFSLSTGVQDKELSIAQNVQIQVVGRLPQERSRIGTILFFWRFCKEMSRSIKKNNPDFLLLYDHNALLAWYLIRPFCSQRPKLWYHSHDVIEPGTINRFSLDQCALFAQKRLFPQLHLFTLPSVERLAYFPTEKVKGRTIHLPNYPSKWLFSPHQNAHSAENANLRLIYQGRVSEEHGLLEIIAFIGQHPEYSLTIIGPSSQDFLDKLTAEISKTDTCNRVFIYPPMAFEKLIPFSARFDIGIAINIPRKIIYKTGGTASNKLYEYAALGLPTIYYDDPHYNEYMNTYKWAFPTNLSFESLSEVLNTIKKSYTNLSKQALLDFETKMNFEKHFTPVLAHLNAPNNA